MKRSEYFFKKFIDDENVSINIYRGDLYVKIQSYNFCLLEEPSKAKRYFERLKKYKDDILEKYNFDVFVCQVDDYNIDGLYESNSKLLFKNSKIYSNY